MSTQVRYLSVDGRVVPYEQGTIHMLTPTIKYGAAVFESIRGYWNAVKEELYLFRLDDHLRRLQYGMKVMRFEGIFSLDMMRSAILELINANGLREAVYIRMFAYLAGDGELTATGPIGLAIAATPRSGTSKASGVHVGVSSWRRIADATMPARVKCIANYQNSRMAAIEAKMNGYLLQIIFGNGVHGLFQRLFDMVGLCVRLGADAVAGKIVGNAADSRCPWLPPLIER
jgi:branched-chain amino acid aminotransferase